MRVSHFSFVLSTCVSNVLEVYWISRSYTGERLKLLFPRRKLSVDEVFMNIEKIKTCSLTHMAYSLHEMVMSVIGRDHIPNCKNMSIMKP